MREGESDSELGAPAWRACGGTAGTGRVVYQVLLCLCIIPFDVPQTPVRWKRGIYFTCEDLKKKKKVKEMRGLARAAAPAFGNSLAEIAQCRSQMEEVREFLKKPFFSLGSGFILQK